MIGSKNSNRQHRLKSNISSLICSLFMLFYEPAISSSLLSQKRLRLISAVSVQFVESFLRAGDIVITVLVKKTPQTAR